MRRSSRSTSRCACEHGLADGSKQDSSRTSTRRAAAGANRRCSACAPRAGLTARFTYDLALPSSDVQLRPGDGEAESFELCEPERIMRRMRNGEFKPNCALGACARRRAADSSADRLLHPPRHDHKRERARLL